MEDKIVLENNQNIELPVGQSGGGLKGLISGIKEKFVNVFDSYGEDFIGPGIRKKTMCGACVSIFAKSVIFGLFIYFLVQLIQDNRSTVEEGRILLNLEHRGSGYDTKFLDVPTLLAEISSEVTFYENNDYSSIQKIHIRDKDRYDDDLFSSDEPIPSVKTMFKKNLKIRINTTSSILVNQTNSFKFTSINSEYSIEGNEANPKFDQILKELYFQNNVYEEMGLFHEHTAHMYVRFNPEQFSLIQPCQIQVNLINKVVLDNLEELKQKHGGIKKNVMLFESFSSQISLEKYFKFNDTKVLKGQPIEDLTTDSLNTNFLISPMNVIYLQKKMKQIDYDDLRNDLTNPDDISMIDFMDWYFQINYVNNFKTVELAGQCRGIENKDLFQDNTLTPLLIPKNSHILPVLIDPQINSDDELNQLKTNLGTLQFPVYVALRYGNSDIEYVKLIDVNAVPGVYSFPYLIFATDGMNQIDFIKLANSTEGINGESTYDNWFNLLTQTPITYHTAPSQWTCPQYWWIDKYCDCNCGEIDPDCVEYVEDMKKKTYYVNQTSSYDPPTSWMTISCNPGFFCSYETNPTCFEPPKFDSPITVFCSTKPKMTQTNIQTVGYLGNPNEIHGECSICPTDRFLNETTLSTFEKCNQRIFGYFDNNHNGLPIEVAETSNKSHICYEYNIKVRSTRKFPKVENKQFYHVKIALEEEKIRVLNVKDYDDDDDTQILCLESNKEFVYGGDLIGAIHLASKNVFVTDSNFPLTLSDFHISINNKNDDDDEIILHVKQVSRLDSSTQILELYQFPKLNEQLGVVGKIRKQSNFTIIQTNSNIGTYENVILSMGNLHDLAYITEIEQVNIGWKLTTTTDLNYLYGIGGLVGYTSSNTFTVKSLNRTIKVVQPDEYSPENYYKSVGSPKELDIDVFLYVVPDSKYTGRDNGLCPKFNKTNEGNNVYNWIEGDGYSQYWKKWNILDDRKGKITECTEIEVSNTSTCGDLSNLDETEKEQLLEDNLCVKQHPPHSKLKFTHEIPVNNKWDFDNTNTFTSSVTRGPEYAIKREYIYTFQHERQNSIIEEEYEQMSDLDVDQHGNILNHASRKIFIGKPSENSWLSANYPILETSIKSN